MPKLSLAFFLVAVVASAAGEEMEQIPATDALTHGAGRITALLGQDGKACENIILELEKEIATRRHKISEYEKQITTVRETFEVSRKELEDELSAIREVKQLVASLAKNPSAPANAAATTAAQAKITALESKGSSASKMAGVLRNIVLSVSSSSTPSIDVTEVLNLLSELEANLVSTLESASVTTEVQTITEKKSEEEGKLQELLVRLKKTKSECDRRKSELSEVIAILKVLEQKFSNITIPNCQPALEEQGKVLTMCMNEKKVLDQDLTVAKTKIYHLEQSNQNLTVHLQACQASEKALSQEAHLRAKCEAELKTSQEEVTVTHSALAKCSSEKTTLDAKLDATRKQLAEKTEEAKCLKQEEKVRLSEVRVKELESKLEIAEKCAENYKILSEEKAELVQQIEKLSGVNTRLERCESEAAKAAKECSDAALESSRTHAKAVDELHKHITKLNEEISTLHIAAECKKERDAATALEKEIITIKTTSEATISSLTTKLHGLQSELSSAKHELTTITTKFSNCSSHLATVSQQLQIVKADHSNCLNLHQSASQERASLAAALKQCRSESLAELKRYESMLKIKQQLEVEEKNLRAEHAALLKTIDTLKKEIHQATAKITGEETKIISLTKDVEEHRRKEKELETRSHTVETEYHHTSTELVTVEKRIREVQLKLKGEEAADAALKKELAELQQRRENLAKKEQELQKALTKAKEEAAYLRDFKAVAVKKLEEARQAVSTHSQHLDALNARLASLLATQKDLELKLSTCSAHVKSAESSITTLKSELDKCHRRNAELEIKFDEAKEAAKCTAHRSTITQLRNHRDALDTEVKTLTSVKRELTIKVSKLESELSTWHRLVDKLRSDLKKCSEEHLSCQSSVGGLKKQMLSNLRKISGHVQTVSRLEVRVSSLKVELERTQKQWHADRVAYKTFKDALLLQISKLIAVAKDAKHKFDVARAAAKNELKVQDAQWGICRKQVLNYERMLGHGVVSAEKEKLKAFVATQHYLLIKKKVEKTEKQNAKLVDSIKKHQEELHKLRKLPVPKPGTSCTIKKVTHTVKTPTGIKKVVTKTPVCDVTHRQVSSAVKAAQKVIKKNTAVKKHSVVKKHTAVKKHSAVKNAILKKTAPVKKFTPHHRRSVDTVSIISKIAHFAEALVEKAKKEVTAARRSLSAKSTARINKRIARAQRRADRAIKAAALFEKSRAAKKGKAAKRAARKVRKNARRVHALVRQIRAIVRKAATAKSA